MKKQRRGFRLLALLLLPVLFSACGPRNLYTDRSIPAQVGYPDAETYIQALRQTPLGSFGCTWEELAEAGYLTEEGTWTVRNPEKEVYTVRRNVAGKDCRTDFIFRTTLFTEAEGKLVLTDIRVEYPIPNEDEESERIRAQIYLQGETMLEGWTVLNDRFAVHAGRYTHALTAGEEECWEFLDWVKRPEDQADITETLEKGWKQSYQVRCTPVTLGDCLTEKELETLADLAVEKGWAGDRAEGLNLFKGWHLGALVMKNPTGHWDYKGEGIALYLTRPGAEK